MRGIIIYVCILTGLFYFSEGKPCPEKTRPHKTRCDSFYKCRELKSNSHVWVPVRCMEGLVYEHNVGSCVLPGEDWECLTASELVNSTPSSADKDANIIIVNNKNEDDDDNVQIILDGTLSSEEQETDVSGKSAANATQHSEEESFGISQFDSSGDGELVELESPPPAENREGELHIGHTSTKNQTSHVETNGKQPGSNIDPNLTAHLQRLSQLIDGLQQTYQKTEKPQLEMRPDQLNAFLAHFDLKNHYDMIDPLGSYKESPISSTTMPPSTESVTSSTSTPPSTLPEPSLNKTRLQEHLSKQRLQPETKLLLSNTQPYGAGYGNSQIVVNRPEGSVLFTLPQYGHSSEQVQPQPQYSSSSHEFSEHEPKISEDTLKTVLELSKQMIAAQNLPKVLPNPAYNGAYYAQPILQPVILSTHNNPYQPYYSLQNYESPPMPPRTHYVHHKKKQPSTTIIHNNVIPVHLSSTSSGEKEVLDAYGNSLGVYPSIKQHLSHNQEEDSNSSNNYYNKFMATMTTARPSNGMALTTMSSQYTGQYAAPYASEFVQTTPRPFEQQPTPATVANFYTPSPHLSENNVNRIYQAGLSISHDVPHPMDMQGMFPTQLAHGQVKIRPNSEKIESMEDDTDEVFNTNYANSNKRHNVLTYSSSGGTGSANMLSMSQQLTPGSYMEHSYAMSENAASEPQQQQQHQFKVPFMLRPTAPSLSSSSIYSDAGGTLDMSMFSSTAGMGHMPGHTVQVLPSKQRPHAVSKLVNFNGNFISLDVFQKSIMPLLTQSPAAMSELGNVEVITCQPGVRQPNQTDCTRYFVCSKLDGKVLSYSCPPYTGFNQQTRICDATTYAQCGNMPIFGGYTIDENRRLQADTLKMLAEAKRRKDAAMKAQSLANLLQQYGQEPDTPAASIEQNLLDSYMVSLPTTTMRPPIAMPTLSPLSSASSGSSSSSSGGATKKRKYYCKEGDKIPDQTSISSYFVCYKNAEGNMKGHKMTCSKSLVFCPQTLMCTLASKCSG